MGVSMSVRIQFDITEEEYKRISRYIPGEKMRHSFAYIALMEWVNRKEGHDVRLKRENKIKERSNIEPIVLDILKQYGMVKDE